MDNNNDFDLDSFVGGLIESPDDDRDFPMSAVQPILASIPSDMPRTFQIPIQNQGTNPSCVGHACAIIRSYLAFKQGIDQVFDEEWIYRQCKQIDGMPNTPGTFFRAGMQVMQKVGAMPSGGGDPSLWKIDAYAKVDDLDALDRANFLFGAILCGFKGSNPGWAQSHVRAPLAGETQWQHAIARVGFGADKNGIIQNSWGMKMGDNGLFYHSPDYLPFEAWICIVGKLPQAQSGLDGYIAKQYVASGKTLANVNLRDEPAGNIIKVLPAGTAVKEFPDEVETVGGIVWEYIVVDGINVK
jgi:hypothetical protein